MKFDIVRAWKDEAYRQTLGTEQLQALPANPAGELSDMELAEVFGGFLPGNGSAFGAAASASSRRQTVHTFSGFCDFNFASFTLPVLAIPHLLSFTRCIAQICGGTH